MYLYDEDFFASGEEQSREIAEIIMPYVLNKIRPKSIVDFGCGEGLWLNVAKNIDKELEILGIDGDYINRERLKIPVECFRPANLENEINLEHKYDLAMSLEVAEHLDENASDRFVDSITKCSENILFSAAIPGQGGVNHLNEQWQSYWIEKFVKKGYSVDASIRDFFWNEERITPWRRQNILLFSKEGKEEGVEQGEIYDVVHPQMFEYANHNHSEVSSPVKEIYCKIDEGIANLVRKGFKNFVVYPFGQNGYLSKEILNYKYNIKELAVVDNKLCKDDPDILSVRQLASLTQDYCVLENCSNPELHEDVLNAIREYIDESRIFSIFK